MKKLLALVLALVTVFAVASPALGEITWAAPYAGSNPFKFEVVKQAYIKDFTGASHLTVITEEESSQYPTATINYYMKVTVPPVQEINNFYNLSFDRGDKIKLVFTIRTRNVTQLSDTASAVKTVTVILSNEEQIVKFSDTSKGAEFSVDVAIKTSLEDILIDGAWRVAEKEYYGVVPCVNCAPVDLSGYIFTSGCADHSYFFSTNKAGKVTGIYIVPTCGVNKTTYKGTLRNMPKALYGWYVTGVENVYAEGECSAAGDKPTSCGLIRFSKREIPEGAYITKNYWRWEPKWNSYMDQWCTEENFIAWRRRNGSTKTNEKLAEEFRTLYYYDDNRSLWTVEKNSAFLKKLGDGGWDYTNMATLYSDIEINNSSPYCVATARRHFDDFNVDMYNYAPDTDYLRYKHTYCFTNPYQDETVFKMTSATTVDCDTNEAAYLSGVNHMLSLMDFTYDDMAAGNIYMTEDILLSNFSLDTQLK